jgi:hypothetical protein
MRVITGITTCKARQRHADAIVATYFDGLPNPFFFLGDPGKPARKEADTVLLDCPDSYEHLPRKLFALYEQVLAQQDFDWFLKLDDDAYVECQLLQIALRHLKSLPRSRSHYVGQIVTVEAGNEGARLWHVDKVSEPELDRRFDGNFEHPYCAGGAGVFLSRTAIQLIVRHGRERFLATEELYEDKLHGEVLGKLGIAASAFDCHFLVPDLSPKEIRRRHGATATLKNSALNVLVGDPAPLLPGLCCVQWRSGTTDSVPLPDSSVTSMEIASSLSWVARPEMNRLLQECRRVLSGSGDLTVNWWNSRDTAMSDSTLWNRHAIQDALLDAGFVLLPLHREEGVCLLPEVGRPVRARPAADDDFAQQAVNKQIILLVESAVSDVRERMADFLNAQAGFRISKALPPWFAMALEHFGQQEDLPQHQFSCRTAAMLRELLGSGGNFGAPRPAVVGFAVEQADPAKVRLFNRRFNDIAIRILRIGPNEQLVGVGTTEDSGSEQLCLQLEKFEDASLPSRRREIEQLTGLPLDPLLLEFPRPPANHWRNGVPAEKPISLPLPPWEGPGHYEFSSGKVAFLFLTRGDINHPEVWEGYFKHGSDDHRIYVHAKHPHEVVHPLFCKTLIPSLQQTQWGHVSLVRATLQLLKAALAEPDNEAFVLCSESCVPVRTFASLRRHLRLDPFGILPLSTIEVLRDREPSKAERHVKAPSIPAASWRFHPQWFLMGRAMAEAATEYDITAYFESVFAPDECYFGTVLALRGFPFPRFPSERPMTYSDWSGGGPSPTTFETIDSKLLQDLITSKMFFARKFPRGAAIDQLLLPLVLPSQAGTLQSDLLRSARNSE